MFEFGCVVCLEKKLFLECIIACVGYQIRLFVDDIGMQFFFYVNLYLFLLLG